MKTRNTSAAVLVGLAACLAGWFPALAQENATAPTKTPDVIFVPTPQEIVETMLKLANVKPDEMVYDLGCGDGRIVITAARDFGARGIGVDIDPQRIAESKANAEAAGVTDRVQFKQEDLFEMHFADADVVCLYLLPSLNVRLRPRILDELRPGTRIVSHSFDMGDWPADQTEEGFDEGQSVYFWIVPAKVAGDWKLALPGGQEAMLAMVQEYQKVTGAITIDGRTIPISDGKLKGRTLTFTFGTGRAVTRATAEITGNKLAAKILRGSPEVEESWAGERQF